MIDFPASPTVGQTFTAAGVTWTWDGTKWVAAGLGVAYLPLSGGTLSGNLIIGRGSPLFYLNATAGANLRGILGQTAGASRWGIFPGGTGAETGSNAGSDFTISNYSDAGAFLGTPLSINRASGLVTIPNLSAPGVIGDNRIINGECRIDQRNNGASGQAAGYTVDRWAFAATQTNRGTWQRVVVGSPLSPFPYSLRFQNSTTYTLLATDHFNFSQPIEADMVSDFQWGTANAQPVTLSFWIYSSNPGAYSGSISNYAGTRSYPFVYSISTISAWTYVTITIPGDTAGTWVMNGNGGALYVNFDLGSGANFRGPANAWASSNFLGVTGAFSVAATASASFCVTGVKLENGSIATPYNRQSLTKSMADCQRYYQVGQFYLQAQAGAAAQSISYGYGAPVVMRAAPTMTVSTQANANWTSSTIAYSPAVGLFYATGAAIAAGATVVNFNFTANAEL